MNKVLKFVFIGLGVVLVIVVVLAVTKKKPATTSSGLTSTSGLNQAQPIAAQQDPLVIEAQTKTDELVTLLSQVSAINLDTSILDAGAFLQLRDLSIAIPKDSNPGRANPFLPIGSNGRTADTPTTPVTSNTTAV